MFSKTFNCDCVEGMKMLDDDSIDLTITSPPYDNLRQYTGFNFDYQETLKEIYRVTKPGGVVVWIVADQSVNGSETGTSFRQALYAKEIGFNINDTMIWYKGVFTDVASLRFRYAQTFEYMFIFSKGMPKTFNPIKDRKSITAGKTIHGTVRHPDGSLKPMWSQGKKIGDYGIRFNVWHLPSEQDPNTIHPAIFPKRLVLDHMKSWSNEGDVVLDPFLGSGTTRFVAYDMNRNFIGYEISKEYFEEEERRFAEYTSQMSLFSNDFDKEE